jgi:inosose dehydratase
MVPSPPPARAPHVPDPARRLPRASIGIVPIVWNNVDLVDLAPEIPASVILDEAVRLGYEGVQFGRGFPEGPALAEALRRHDLRLAEVYAELPVTADGPSDDALEIGLARLAILHEAGGDVLVPACRVGGGRSEWAGRGDAPDCPRLSEAGWRRFAEVVDALATATAKAGHRLAFHPHGGTYVETRSEVQTLARLTDPDRVGFCLDVGHYIVGGGDPAAAIGELGERVRHVHLKDVDPDVLAGLRDRTIEDFEAAIRRRLFTELGNGLLDLGGVIDALEQRAFDGWLMVEQDSSWLAPGEAAAVGRRVLAFALGGRRPADRPPPSGAAT